MHIAYTAEQQRLRDELRAYYDELLTDEIREHLHTEAGCGPVHRQMVKQMAADGWLGIGWPKEYGGQGRSQMEQFIFFDESMRSGAPVPMLTINTVGPTIMQFGTDEQKDFFLPRILNGEVFFCQGYSEPEAGSDLAALSMAARDDGDHLVCTGSKIWTTHAREANWMFALVRTTRSDKKQRGITFVLIDLTSPGIEIRPLVMTSGEEVQNQVFFDEVRVPKTNVIGAIDDGW